VISSGAGLVELAVVAGATAVVRRRATTPLKLLTPRSMNGVAHVVASTYGGGLLAGDEVALMVMAGPATRCTLGTQASTKVYRSEIGQVSRQSLEADVGPGAILAVAPDPVTCFAGARYEQCQRFRLAAGASLLLLYPALLFCGAAINLGNERIEPAEGAMIWAAENLMPTLAGVIVLAGIVAAGLSSATTFLSLVAFSASHDVMRSEGTSDAAKLRISRWTMIGVGLAALALSMVVPPNIFWITYFAGTVFASSWGSVAFMSVWSRRITEAGAFWGIRSPICRMRKLSDDSSGRSRRRPIRVVV
jgi:sodium/pantothenate symporter